MDQTDEFAASLLIVRQAAIQQINNGDWLVNQSPHLEKSKRFISLTTLSSRARHTSH